MVARPLQQQTRFEIINFTGGLNEVVSNLELTPGELSICENYVERDDVYSGYESVAGYERFDGQTKPSSIDATETNHTARDAARTAITAPAGVGECRGIFIFNDKIHTVRDRDNGASPAIYKDVWVESASGWSKVTAFGDYLNAGGSLNVINGRMSLFNSNNPIVVITDGVSNAVIYNGSTVTQIPEPDTGIGFPFLVNIFKERLLMAFPSGNIVFSSIGDPTDYDTSTDLAGRVKIGDEITAIQETKGGILTIATKTSLRLWYYGTVSNDPTFIFKMDTFSNSLGAIKNTMKPLLGTTAFCDVSGMTTLVATDTFGDFKENNLTKKVQNSYIPEYIIGGVTDKAKGRYYIYFSKSTSSYALCVSMKGNKVKSVTRLTYPLSIKYITNVYTSDGKEYIYFGDADGMVYQGFIGTSHDGAEIKYALRTGFYAFKSPRIWKRFSKLHFEAESTNDFTCAVNTKYNYESPSLPATDPLEGSGVQVASGAPVWHSPVAHDDPVQPNPLWGSFSWSRGSVSQSDVYISGYGSNMALYILSKSAYNASHTIYNVQVSYTLNSQQL